LHVVNTVSGLRFASLGSGSEGNALLVQSGRTTVMIDCGFGIKELIRRSERIGFDLSALTAIIITHEHGDHVGGAPRLARRLDVPVWLTFGTLSATESMWQDCRLRGFDSHDAFAIDDLEILPFPVPHDAREPAQMVITDGDTRLGVLTDVGESTAHIEASLSDCDALFLEANHCADMLRNSDYHVRLKARISGRFGHLSNDDSAAILARIAGPKLKRVAGAHLSRQNNLPALVRTAFERALRGDETAAAREHAEIMIATQDDGLPWTPVA
jgi:phosphoribosyl 1,2-cyclic phosphodiesterase